MLIAESNLPIKVSFEGIRADFGSKPEGIDRIGGNGISLPVTLVDYGGFLSGERSREVVKRSFSLRGLQFH